MDHFPAPDLDVAALAAELDRTGFATTPPLLDARECAEVAGLFSADGVFRSTVVMARHQFGEGSYRYFDHPLPGVVRRLRERLYPPLARIANAWADRLGEPGFPDDLAGLHARCAAAGQLRPTPLLLRYEAGGYNCLHQDLYGDVWFPLQVAIMLNAPDRDFTGGESVFVEQRPRAQSRPMVARPGLGQGLVFAVNSRPVPSARGHKRVVMRHGVSEVRSGVRHTLGIIFHDAR
ncbi:2OG-Fe(II) oxygenase [Saccharothrix obliqua]|uniref:2OG-Fe(II) oxygenase n=1 Tax=Saccharothrix obliqua TaxID=2861747 RepID=UPI0027E2C230|nr:2OG-Fe(II) oxygenase [Saccharothrix obliqua]